MIQYRTAHSQGDLAQILALQAQNIPKNLEKGDATADGFVSLEHSYELLKGMNYPHPHIIAVEEGMLVGYTLMMHRYWKEQIPLLIPMIDQIDAFSYKGELLQEASYFIMGQVCVAASHRGKGVFRGLYQKLKQELDHHFQYCITGISSKNQRSLNAHQAIGFETIFTYPDEKASNDWHGVLWDWRSA